MATKFESLTKLIEAPIGIPAEENLNLLVFAPTTRKACESSAEATI